MNIYELQNNEHQKILHHLQLVADAEDSSAVGDLFNRFRIELCAHKIAEEQTLFKFLAEQGIACQTSMSSIKNQHAKLEEILNRLRRDEDLEWNELEQGLCELREVLLNDIQGEEKLLNDYQSCITHEQANKLANEMSACKLNFEKRLIERLTAS